MTIETAAAPKRRGLEDLRGGRRRAVGVSTSELVTERPLFAEGGVPLLVEPAVEGVDLAEWAKDKHDWIEERLRQGGGILFRGFGIKTPDRFEAVIAAVAGNLLEYKERSSPRSQVVGNIYTSTDYPPDQSIFLHNENSYQYAWPLKIFFYCHIAAETGGETPIADVRKVLAAIPEDLRRRFEERGIAYVRNYRQGMGLPWKEVFQTDDPAVVEEYCKGAGLEPEWLPDGDLRTRSRRPAVARHPRTGEALWFNHATFFHISTLPEPIRNALLERYGEDALPNNTYYGDGSPIEPEVMETLRGAYGAATVTFPWQQGDVLLLDNMMVAHARNPFTGQRKVLVGMAEAINREEVA